MSKKRTYSPELKARVVLEVLSQQTSLAQAAGNTGCEIQRFLAGSRNLLSVVPRKYSYARQDMIRATGG